MGDKAAKPPPGLLLGFDELAWAALLFALWEEDLDFEEVETLH